MRQLLFCLLFLFASPVFSQSGAIGSWREHLPYRQGNYVAVSEQRIFCATNQGLFAYRRDDESLERLSKLSGLSDFGISHIMYSADYNLLVIAYENANIDLLDNSNRVINLSDISRKNIPGNKRINRITLDGRFVYLACGFGIVVMDLQRREIKDTYYIGINGAPVDVREVALSDDFIFAATESGVFQAQRSNQNLSDYNNWSMILADSSNGTFTRASVINNQLLVNYQVAGGDSILLWNNGWSIPANLPQSGVTYSLRNNANRLFVTKSDQVYEFDSGLNLVQTITVANIPGLIARDAVNDNAGSIWMADFNRGLLQYNGSGYTSRFPAGPNTEAVAAMSVVDGRLWVIHGPKNRGWTNAFQYHGFSYYEDGGWKSFDGYAAQTPLFSQYNFYDNMALAVDPSNKERLFVSSGGAGLIEFNAGNLVRHVNTSNSTLKEQFGNPGQVKVHGIALDDKANLWVANAGVNTVLNVFKADGLWRAYTFPGVINSSAKSGDLVIDQNGAKWVILFENTGQQDGLLYFDDNGTIDNLSDDVFKLIPFASNRVRSLAMDKDGTIWAGMDAGINVFYPPSLEPQKIIIKQENAFQYLLETESVTAIAVDGGNRKWVGTENAGLFLFSPDGQTQLQHFTALNSPLFSNNIYAIAIDGKSGQVYIGTDKGVLSYQGDAVEGKENCSDVEVYPNPVQSGYAGPVAIKGVPANGTVKITDVSGNLVFQTQSLGGQAVWNGTNLSGERVSTGVYLIFAMDPEGESTCTSKVLFTR